MKAIATDLCLRWLSEPAADPLHVAAEHSELPRTAAPFPDGQGDGWIELQDLHLGMHLCRVVHRFAPGQADLVPMSDVRASLGIAALPSAQVHPVPGPLKAILESCLVDSLTGSLRRLHAQARVLDFLVALVGQRDALVRPEVRQRIPIIRLREELDQLYGSVPGLDELARRYGVSARALNECFKEAFGRTIFAYVTARRLEAAQACLRGGQAPLKTDLTLRQATIGNASCHVPNSTGHNSAATARHCCRNQRWAGSFRRDGCQMR